MFLPSKEIPYFADIERLRERDTDRHVDRNRDTDIYGESILEKKSQRYR